MKKFADLRKGNNDGIKIKCRCESKSEPYAFNKEGKAGKVVNFSFFDGDGLMNGSSFDQNTIKKVKKGKTYILKKIFIVFNK